MYTNWSKPTPGRITYLIHDSAVIDAVVLREIKYGSSFKKDRRALAMDAGEFLNDAYTRYEVGRFDCDGEWVVSTVESDDLFEEAGEAFAELRKRRAGSQHINEPAPPQPDIQAPPSLEEDSIG